MPVLDAVYPDYFGQVPEEIRKGSTKVKAIFKGQYQIYPPIKTLTLKNFKPIDYNVKFFLVTYSQYGYNITLTFSQTGCPSFYFNYSLSELVGGTGTYSGDSTIIFYQKQITLTSTQTSITFSTNSTTVINYGITTNVLDKTTGNKKITFMSGSTRIVISLEADRLYADEERNGYSIYTWDVEEYKSSTALYGSMQSFRIYQEDSRSTAGASTLGEANYIPIQQSDTADTAYVKSGKLYLYSSYLPTVPYNGFTIENFGAKPITPANCGACTMSYFYQLPAPVLPDYYANLTGNKNTVNLFDYDQGISKTATYRYDIQEQALPNYIFKANITQNYDWDYDGSTLTVVISRGADPFYVLDFYVSTVPNVYVELAKQRGASYGVEYESGYVGSGLSTYPLTRSVDFTQTWNLSDKSSKASQYGATALYSSFTTTTLGNYSSTKFTTSQRTYTLHMYNSSSVITSSSSSTPVKAGAGIDWFSTWWWAHGGSTTKQGLGTYLNNTYKTLTASTTCPLYVYALCWQGFIGKAYHIITFKYVGQLNLKTKVNNNATGLKWTY